MSITVLIAGRFFCLFFAFAGTAACASFATFLATAKIAGFVPSARLRADRACIAVTGVIEFSPQMATIVIESNKVIEHTVRANIGVTVTDYCIMQLLYINGDKMSIASLNDFIYLKPNSVASAVGRLEKKGYIARKNNPNDRRSFFISLTPAGTEACELASVRIREDLTRLSWEDPDDERINWGMEVHASLFFQYRNLSKDVSEANFLNLDLDKDVFVVPGWVSSIALIQRYWNETATREFNMTINEYRVLAFLAREKDGAAATSEIIDHLFFGKSAMSFFLKALKERNLVTSQENPNDRRHQIISLTDEGRRVESEAFESLRGLTMRYFSPLPPDAIARQNQWHLDMCAALYRLREKQL